jgi:virginiamycin B lyase
LLAVLVPDADATGTAHLYWSNYGTNPGSIGRAGIDGTHVVQDFVPAADAWDGVAVDDAHIYWTDSDSNAIGRSKLDGSRAKPTFITTGVHYPDQVMVTAAHVYWSNYNLGTIGRANIDGTHVKQAFITGATNPSGIAANKDHIYWTNYTSTTIGRANIDGTHVKQAFIKGASSPGDILVNKVTSSGRTTAAPRSGAPASTVPM